MEPTLPAVHALHLAELAKRWDVAPEELFEGTGLRASELSVVGARLTLPQVERLIARARQLTGEDGIGILAGMAMRVSAHGYLGFAAMTASTVGDALRLATRFAPTLTNTLTLSLHVHDEHASLVLEERADFGTARDAVLFALVVGIWQIGNALTGTELSGSADLAFPRPAYFDRFEPIAPRTRFSQPVNQLVFAAKTLALPLTNADPVSRQLAQEQCERTLEAMSLDGDVLARVRGLVLGERGVRSIDDVASAVHLSTRTLKRKLASHGLTYTDVLEEQRRESAMLLLRSPALSLEDVAERLGYSDVANFSRAFRRWTGGTSPGAFRKA